MQVLTNERRPSDRLQQAVRNCALGFRKLKDSIEECLEIGRNEGYKDIEIGSMIRQEMLTNNYSIRSVQRYLPSSMKRSGGYESRNDNLSFQLQLQPSNYNSKDL